MTHVFLVDDQRISNEVRFTCTMNDYMVPYLMIYKKKPGAVVMPNANIVCDLQPELSSPDITESYNFVFSELTQQCSSSNEKSAENCEIDDIIEVKDDDIVMNDSCYTIDDVVPMDTQNDYDDCSTQILLYIKSVHIPNLILIQ